MSEKRRVLIIQANAVINMLTRVKNTTTDELQKASDRSLSDDVKEKLRKLYNAINIIFEAYTNVLTDHSSENITRQEQTLEEIDAMWTTGPMRHLIDDVDNTAYTKLMKAKLLRVLEFMSSEANSYIRFKEKHISRSARVQQKGIIRGNIEHLKQNWGNHGKNLTRSLREKLGVQHEGLASWKAAKRASVYGLGALSTAAGIFLKSGGIGVAGAALVAHQHKKIKQEREEYEQHFKTVLKYRSDLKEALSGAKYKVDTKNRLAGGGKFKAKRRSNVLVGDNPGGVEQVVVSKKSGSFATKTSGPALVSLNKGEMIHAKPISGVGVTSFDPRNMVPTDEPVAKFGAGTDGATAHSISTPIVNSIEEQTAVLRELLSQQDLHHRDQMARMDDAANASKGYTKAAFKEKAVAAQNQQKENPDGFIGAAADLLKDGLVAGVTAATMGAIAKKIGFGDIKSANKNGLFGRNDAVDGLSTGRKAIKYGISGAVGLGGGYAGYKAGDWASDQMGLEEDSTARKVVEGGTALAGGVGSALLTNKLLGKVKFFNGAKSIGSDVEAMTEKSQFADKVGATPVYVVNADEIGGDGGLDPMDFMTKKGGKKAAKKAAKEAAERAAKEAAEAAVAKGTEKVVAKTIGKGLLKKIPILGMGAGAFFGAQRLMSGDALGAGMELASGAASLIPGFGTAASLGIDAALAGRDVMKATDAPTAEATNSLTLAAADLRDATRKSKEQVNKETKPNSALEAFAENAGYVGNGSNGFGAAGTPGVFTQARNWVADTFGVGSRSTDIRPGSPLAKQREANLLSAAEAQGITDPKEKAAFMAQMSHESIGFSAMKEKGSGARYEGRRDLGNVYAGDGERYKGRGFVQLTGRSNYADMTKRLQSKFPGIDLVANPELMEREDVAQAAAIEFWKKSGAGAAARAGDIETTSARINGRNRTTGRANGIEDRIARTRQYEAKIASGAFAAAPKGFSAPISTTDGSKTWKANAAAAAPGIAAAGAAPTGTADPVKAKFFAAVDGSNKSYKAFRAKTDYKAANLPERIDSQAAVQDKSLDENGVPKSMKGDITPPSSFPNMVKAKSPRNTTPVPTATAVPPVQLQQAHVEQQYTTTQDRQKVFEKERLEKSVQTALLQHAGGGITQINSTTTSGEKGGKTVVTTGDDSLLAMYNMYIGQMA